MDARLLRFLGLHRVQPVHADLVREHSGRDAVFSGPEYRQLVVPQPSSRVRPVLWTVCNLVDALSQKDIDELVAKKLEKESNRFIQQWPEEKIAIENGRWGAFIRFGKNMLKLSKNEAREKFSPEELSALSLEEVKKMIEAQVPGAFDKKGKKASAKTASVKASPKKAPAKKNAVKKAAKKAVKKSSAKKTKKK